LIDVMKSGVWNVPDEINFLLILETYCTEECVNKE